MPNRITQAVVADDEPLLRAELCQALQAAWPSLQVVASVGDGHAAINAVLAHQPAVVFLDINMPHLDGLSTAERLRQAGFSGDIVFVTAYEQHALKAFDHRAIDYLVKPLDHARLGQTVVRLQARQHQTAPISSPAAQQALLAELKGLLAAGALPPEQPEKPEPLRWLRVSSGNHVHLVAIDDVACFRATPGYTQVTTVQGEHLITQSLKALLPRLDPQCFVQVHRAAIVNLNFVDRFTRPSPGRYLIELKAGLGTVQASRSPVDLVPLDEF